MDFEKRNSTIMPALLAVLVLAAVLAGCSQQAPSNVGETSPSAPGYSPPPDPPKPSELNFLGNWSTFAGNFSVYRIFTNMTIHNTTSGEIVPRDRCLRPFTYNLDTENKTIRLAEHVILHPSKPSNLSLLYLNEVRFGEKCTFTQIFGFHQNASTPKGCTYGLSAAEANALDESKIWTCHTPVDYLTAKGFLWENVTFEPAHSNGTIFNLTLNGNPVGLSAATNVSAPYPSDESIVLRGNVTIDFLGTWPYGAVRR